MSLESPLVSIVTPSFNKGQYIEETILSIRDQTYPRIEHIAIDGGSTDGTLDVLRKYEDKLTWISEPDRGQSDAVNKGWRMAKGEILGWLNADDVYLPSAVETAVNFLEEHPDVAMVYGNGNIINERGEVTGSYGAATDLATLLIGPYTIPQPAVFFRRRILDEVGYLDTDLHLAMDYDLWVRIGRRYQFGYVPSVLANLRVCAGTKTVDSAYGFGPDAIRVLDKLYAEPDLPKEIAAVRRRAYAYAHMLFFIQHRMQRQLGQAMRGLARALLLDPRTLSKFGGPAMLSGFFLEVLLGSRRVARIMAWKSRVATKSHKRGRT